MHLPSEGDLFTPKSETLESLLPDIHRHKIALPNFQRPWVWGPEMVRDLIISVAYRYPAGSLLTMPISRTGFALRPFEGSGDALTDSPHLMILDGQQRLTSLYQAVFRKDGVHYQGRVYHFYVDITTLLADPDGFDVGDPYFDKALFYVIQDKRTGKRIRYDGLKPLYELTTPTQEIAAGAMPMGFIFDTDQLANWKKQYFLTKTSDLAEYMELDGLWGKLAQPWFQRLKTYRFPVVELDRNMPLGAICHIFEKVNSTGVPLDVFDLCNAILWAQGFHLNEEWYGNKEKVGISQELQKHLPMQKLSGTHFLQGLALLDSLDRKRANPGTGIAVNCRKQDLMAMNRATVERWWPLLAAGYEEAARFMKEQGILSWRILPYTTIIIPLSTIFADLLQRKGITATRAAWSKISQWYWCSVFSQRYSSQVESGAARDYDQVMQWLEGGDPPEVVRTFTFRSDALQEIRSIRNVIYKGVLCLLARRGAKDFGGGGTLSTDLFFDTNQDHHHIFPKDAFKRLGIADWRMDTIVNKTLISANVNRSIGGSLPSEYVSKWRNELGQEAYDDILTSHLVNPDLFITNDWTAFMRDRREQLRQLIQAVCGGVVQPFSDLAELDADEEVDADEYGVG